MYRALIYCSLLGASLAQARSTAKVSRQVATEYVRDQEDLRSPPYQVGKRASFRSGDVRAYRLKFQQKPTRYFVLVKDGAQKPLGLFQEQRVRAPRGVQDRQFQNSRDKDVRVSYVDGVVVRTPDTHFVQVESSKSGNLGKVAQASRRGVLYAAFVPQKEHAIAIEFPGFVGSIGVMNPAWAVGTRLDVGSSKGRTTLKTTFAWQEP